MKTILSLLTLCLTGFAAGDTLSLREATARALETNPGYQAAQQRMLQAQARWKQARSSYLPSINLEGSGNRIEYSDTARESLPFLEKDADQFAAGAQANWLLFHAGRASTIRAASHNLEASRALELEGRLQLIAAVARSYHQAQLARENIRIAESDVAFNERQFRETRRAYRAGNRAYADTLNFEIRKNAAASTLEQTRSNYLAAQAALAALLNLSDHESIEPEELTLPDSPPTSPDLLTAWNHARSHLPSLAAQRALVEASEAGRRAVHGEYAPELRLVGGINAERQDDPDFAGEDVGSTIGLSLNLNFWDGGARRGRLNEATATRNEQEFNLQAAELDARAELLAAIADLDSSGKQLLLQRRNAELTRTNRDLIEKSYRAGSESLIRLNEAQRDFISAESRLVLSAIQVATAEIRVQQATGQLLQGPATDSITK